MFQSLHLASYAWLRKTAADARQYFFKYQIIFFSSSKKSNVGIILNLKVQKFVSTSRYVLLAYESNYSDAQ